MDYLTDVDGNYIMDAWGFPIPIDHVAIFDERNPGMTHCEFGSDPHMAINVKYYGGVPTIDEQLAEAVWDIVSMQFWERANEIAFHDFGYSGVFSEGRSGGWMVPFYQSGVKSGITWPGQGGHLGYPSFPAFDDPDEVEKFLKFAEAIGGLMSEVPELLEAEVQWSEQFANDEEPF